MLNSCPENDDSVLPTPVVKLDGNENSLLLTNKNSYLWKDVYNKIEQHLLTILNLRRKFFSAVVLTSDYGKIYDKLVTQGQYEIMFQEVDKLHKFRADLNSIVTLFGLDGRQHCNVLCKGVVDLESRIEDLLDSVEEARTVELLESEVDVMGYEKRVENLRKKMLLCIQKLYKNYVLEKEKVSEDENDGGLTKCHLKDAILKSLDEEIGVCDMVKVCRRIRGLIKQILKNSSLGTALRKR